MGKKKKKNKKKKIEELEILDLDPEGAEYFDDEDEDDSEFEHEHIGVADPEPEKDEASEEVTEPEEDNEPVANTEPEVYDELEAYAEPEDYDEPETDADAEEYDEPEEYEETAEEATEEAVDNEAIDDFLYRHKRHKRLKVVAGVMAAVLVVTACVGGYLVYSDYKSRVYSHCIIEAGNVAVLASDFAKREDVPVEFAEGFDATVIDPTVPGDYQVALKSGHYNYDAVLTVEDTTAPVADVVPVTLEYGTTAEASQFVENINDVTEVTVAFVTEPDYSAGGDSTVNITLTDTSGNQTAYESTLTIIPIHPEVTIEAGASVPGLDAFLLSELKSDNATAELLTDLEGIDPLEPGEYPVSIKLGGSTYESKLKIEDTEPPVIKTKNFEGYTTSVITPDMLIESAQDKTELTYSFKDEPDLSQEGTVNVTVVATDKGGNSAEGEATLTLALDTEPPVITGAADFNIMENSPISYRNAVQVTDNCDTDIDIKIDTGGVIPKAVGDYPIKYTATDRAGNTAEVTVTLSIVEESYDTATVYALASQVLAQITTPDMNDMQKLSAIYWWVKRNIAYTESNNKDNWTKAAYYGLALHKGDCYTYCMTSKALLDAAGITNMVIDTVPLRNIHFWNLVDIGEGWRHFDTTPRFGGGEFLYLDDATITAYSNAHHNSHIYDRTRFPGIQ